MNAGSAGDATSTKMRERGTQKQTNKKLSSENRSNGGRGERPPTNKMTTTKHKTNTRNRHRTLGERMYVRGKKDINYKRRESGR